MSEEKKPNNSASPRVDNIDKHVSRKLRAKRILLGLSQQSLADEVKVSVQQIQKYERAHNRISSGKLYHFSNFLNVPIEYFFEGLENKIQPYIFTEDVSNVAIDSSVSERDVLILIRAFNEIEDFDKRKKLLELVKTMSEE